MIKLRPFGRVAIRLIVIFSFIPSIFAPSAWARPNYWVIDGDTLIISQEHIRVSNLDAPELANHAKCPIEAQRGLNAKHHATHLVSTATKLTIYKRQGHDKYGRTLARIMLDGQDFGTRMIQNGFARPWRGKTSNWC